MTLRTCILGMVISTFLCFVSLILILIYIDPETAGFIAVILFFLVLFLFLSGFFAVFGFYLRIKLLKNKTGFHQIGVAFRQGIFLSLIFTGMLVLQSFEMLYFWSVALFIISIGLLELYSMSKN
ncbi:MAG: hypothetical protein P1P85_03435 [Patescibacteria group bacterium]|nr:hypothetical protein [Patescibacteria group bacterium]